MLWSGSKYIEAGLVLCSPSDTTLEVLSGFLSGSDSLRRSRISEISSSGVGVIDLSVVASN